MMHEYEKINEDKPVVVPKDYFKRYRKYHYSLLEKIMVTVGSSFIILVYLLIVAHIFVMIEHNGLFGLGV